MILPRALATALLTALALPVIAQDAPDRYVVDVTVMETGVEIASGRTAIVEDGQAEILLTGADGQYTFTANLYLEQGDGADERLILEAYLNHDGTDITNPRLIMKRGGTARMVVGSGTDQMPLTDGVAVEIAPIPTT